MTSSPHDAFFRATFSEPHAAAAELRAVLPARMLDELRLETIAPIEGSFVDEGLRATSADLLFEVQMRGGGKRLVYLLLEHQSTPDPKMPLRLLHYQARIWERFEAEHPERQKVPPIVPIVLHHGPKPWPWPPTFEAALDYSSTSRAAFGRFTIDFEFVLDDLSVQSDEQILGRSMDAVTRLALIALRNSRVQERLMQHVAAVIKALGTELRGPAAVTALARLARYVFEVDESPPNVIRAAFAAALPPDLRSSVMTTADMLRAEGRREMLLDMIEIKFGEIGAESRARIDRATIEDLVAWSRSFVNATTIEEVFREER